MGNSIFMIIEISAVKIVKNINSYLFRTRVVSINFETSFLKENLCSFVRINLHFNEIA